MNNFINYLMIGVTFYILLSWIRYETFQGATMKGVVRGFLFCVLMWPLAVYLILPDFKAPKDRKK